MLSFHFIFSFSKHRFSPELENASFQSISTNEKPKPITHWAHSSRRCPLSSGSTYYIQMLLLNLDALGAEDGALPDWMPMSAEAAPAPCMICMHQALPILPAKACQNHVWDVGAKCGRQNERKRQQDTLWWFHTGGFTEKRLPWCKDKTFSGQICFSPQHIYKLSHNTTEQITPNSSPQKGCHDSRFVSVIF